MVRYNFDAKLPVIVVDVLIENKSIKKKVKMAIDTGATYVLISWDIAEALDLKPAFSEKRVDIITASGIEKAPLLNVDTVRFIDKTADNVDVLIHDLPPKSYVDGLLGLSFLRNFNLHLNFREGYLELD